MNQSKVIGGTLLWYVVLFLIQLSKSEEILPPPCFSEIYCHGRLLDTIQMAKIHEDSKTFVDMKLKKPPNETLQLFDEFMLKWHDKPSKFNIINFVKDNFDEAGLEFEDWDPVDWKPNPGFLDRITDPKLKDWASELNDIWKILGRKMKNDVRAHPELYSIIWVPNPVIVPGGRFREFYYWDSYWIFQGLLLSEMHKTVKGMLENFLYIVDNYGLLPNGGRIYYLARSQPPLLIPMVQMYLEFTNDYQFIKDNIHIMDKEFDYWMKNHTKVINFNGKNYTLAFYGDQSHGPRPESYSEDVESADLFKDDQRKKQEFYSELKAAAESGWDFSSRWFVRNATDEGVLTDIKTRSIAPVELNAFLYWNADLLSQYHEMIGNKNKSIYYRNIANDFIKAVEAVLWHEEIGSWLDYDTFNHVKRDYFYPTNISPLWTGCYNQTKKETIVRSVMKYLQNKHAVAVAGVPSTLRHTGEQWDYPNAWPPMQHLMIASLNTTGDDHAMRLAFEISESWVRSNYKAFRETDAMFEKYDATVPGGHGSGGEYDVQKGFGWTNGIVMNLLWRYPDSLTVEDPVPTPVSYYVRTKEDGSPSSISSITTALIALLVSLTAGFIGLKFVKNCLWKTNSNLKRKPQ